MPNRLAQETSPYLLQHADNPVDWFAWGEEAWAKARAEDKPVLVSIGYSACHWCHVMERESFEDPATAAVMNERFVCIKVDREERPDVDAIYMDALQAMTGQGGWPLNAFATPEQVPFHAGTYFPPTARQGMPAWTQVLDAVADAWTERREQIRTGSGQIVEHLDATARLRASDQAPSETLLAEAEAAIRAHFDDVHGGFGGAPKFPPHSTLEFLLDEGETEMSLATLRAMARGGIHDQVGGGFARYTVDATWTVPHFEKMLYDNALLARSYLHGWLVSGEEELRATCEDTLDWLLREMRGPEGGFYSALDADSEGVEGRFYVWTPAQIEAVLGERAADAMRFWGVTEAGNFEGANILVRDGAEPPSDLEAMRAALLAARAQRVWPGLDDKRLTSWNALAIAALAEAGAVLERDDYLGAARACADFLLRELRDGEGRLLRTWKEPQGGRILGFLDDHAHLLLALLALSEATFEPRWFAAAVEIADAMIASFADADGGGFFTTSIHAEALVARRKDLEDSPVPSGNASAALGLLRLAALSGRGEYAAHAESVIALLHPVAARYPRAFGTTLQAIAFARGPVREVALAGAAGDTRELARVVRRAHRPRVVLAGGTGDVPELLAGRAPVEGRAAAYVCERFACRTPVTEPDELAAALRD